MSYDVKNLRVNTLHRPCFCVFDILLLNDKVLSNEPLKERVNILNKIITDIDGVIMKSKMVTVNSR